MQETSCLKIPQKIFFKNLQICHLWFKQLENNGLRGDRYGDRVTDSWQNRADMQLFRPVLHPNPTVLLLQTPRQTSVLLVRNQRFPRCRPSVSRVETTVFRRTNRWILLNKLMVSALNWRSRSLSSDQSMRPWPLRKKLEKRCFYACRAPNLSLYHPICHPICHQPNKLYTNQLR